MADEPGQREADASYDVVVVGAGSGGLYAVHRLTQRGLSVLGIEADRGVGGVWHHNRYPGARVDVDSVEYSFQFSADLAGRWCWTERYAAQQELQTYFDFVADTLNLRRHFLFDTFVVSARWQPDRHRWLLGTDAGQSVAARFVVMATGNLSATRLPAFPGLETFRGERVLTSRWPEDGLQIAGRHVGVIGTGSSGVQTATAMAGTAARLTVFQRTANYSVPAQNHPLEPGPQRARASRLAAERSVLLARPAGTSVTRPEAPLAAYPASEQRQRLEGQWAHGGQGLTAVFSDQGTDLAVNTVVADFVREKVGAQVRDPDRRRALTSQPYPIGTRRLILDTGYHPIFNQDNVDLVDLTTAPDLTFFEHGVRVGGRTILLDVAVFALGFHAFDGALVEAGVADENGTGFAAAWADRPRTLLGVMACGFPNLFLPTGPGSPSVLVNMILLNEIHGDWIADCIAYLDDHGYRTIVPEAGAQQVWAQHCDALSAALLRRQVENYMVRVAADGSRVFLPYAGGLDRYVPHLLEAADNGYRGFALS